MALSAAGAKKLVADSKNIDKKLGADGYELTARLKRSI